MPTKKKRVGFIPREDVMIIIDKLSIENNLSNSKIISTLVEEALSARGIFSKKNGKATQSYLSYDFNSQNLSHDSGNSADNQKFIINTKLIDHYQPSESFHRREASQEMFDLETYKKFLLFLKFQEMMDEYNT